MKKIMMFILTLAITVCALCTSINAQEADEVGGEVISQMGTEVMCGMEVLNFNVPRKLHLDMSNYNYEAGTGVPGVELECLVFVFFDLDGKVRNFTDAKNIYASLTLSGGYERVSVGEDATKCSEALRGGYTNKGAYSPYAEYWIRDFLASEMSFTFAGVMYGYESNFVNQKRMSLPALYYTDEAKIELSDCTVCAYVGTYKEAKAFIDCLANNDAITQAELTPIISENKPYAQILTAPQYDSEKLGTNGIIKCSQSWMTANDTEYGRISFVVADNGFEHTYGLRVSASNILCGHLETMILSLENCTELKNSIEANYGAGNFTPENFFSYFFNIGENIGKDVGLKYLVDRNEWIEDNYKTILNEFTEDAKTIPFDKSKTLTDSTLDFEKSSSVVVKTVEIADYINMVANNVYRIEVVDLTTNEVLDYTFIYSNKTKNKNVASYGTTTYWYDDIVTATKDIANNEPVSMNKVEFGGVLSVDNNDLFNSPSDYNDQSFENLLLDRFDNLGNVINTAFTGVGNFFDMCWSFLPDVYMSIVVASASVIVLLRILGR